MRNPLCIQREVLGKGGRGKVVRDLKLFESGQEDDDIFAECGRWSFWGLLLRDIDGFTDSAAVFWSEGELNGFEEGTGRL